MIEVNLSGNNIGPECASMLFDTLQDHPSIVSLNISTIDQLRRNRIGAKGCVSLRTFLKRNKILTFLNIADNSIGEEGLEYVIEGLKENKVLLSLDISNNGLSCNSIKRLTDTLLQSEIIEISLKQNEVNDKVLSLIKK